jgi:hypothetical protein
MMAETRMPSKKTIRGKLKRQRQRWGGVRLVYPNERLAFIVGPAPRSREELVEHLQVYVRERGLVDRAGRFVHANQDLVSLFWGQQRIRQSDLLRIVTYHLLPGIPTTPASDPKPKPESEDEEELSLVR